MAFIEHNNRLKANKFAEYITGENLRRYVAEKVRHYVGEAVSVFDGVAGSGQLEQFIKPAHFVAVEIQGESCEALRQNYPHAVVFEQSFFHYVGGDLCDCVVMNPPFSLKFKDLSKEEKTTIQAEYPWKKSGVVDDIFVLKGLAQSKRWGFFILFPGVGYRRTEQMFREAIGHQLVEINWVQNAFEDTPIDVLFLVIDKTKTSDTTRRSLFDCKTNQLLLTDEWRICTENWERPTPPIEKEQIDPIALELEARLQVKKRILTELRFSKMVTELEQTPKVEFNAFCDEICLLVQGEKFENPNAQR